MLFGLRANGSIVTIDTSRLRAGIMLFPLGLPKEMAQDEIAQK
jgi:hypothetical protein